MLTHTQKKKKINSICQFTITSLLKTTNSHLLRHSRINTNLRQVITSTVYYRSPSNLPNANRLITTIFTTLWCPTLMCARNQLTKGWVTHIYRKLPVRQLCEIGWGRASWCRRFWTPPLPDQRRPSAQPLRPPPPPHRRCGLPLGSHVTPAITDSS